MRRLGLLRGSSTLISFAVTVGGRRGSSAAALGGCGSSRSAEASRSPRGAPSRLAAYLRQRLSYLDAYLLDAEAHQRGDVLVALLALREQPEHRPLVLGERHGSRSLRQTEVSPCSDPIKVRVDGRGRHGLHSAFDALVGTEWLDDDPDHARVRSGGARRAAPASRPPARRRLSRPWSRASARGATAQAVLSRTG